MRTATICPGPCNTAWRRAEEVADEAGTEHHITPAWGQPVQCDSCVERARWQLGELPAFLAAVHLEATNGSRAPVTAAIRSSAGADASFPGQAPLVLIETLLGEMEELEADVLQLRGLGAAFNPAGPVGPRITGVVQVLEAHLDWMMQQHPAAAEPHDRTNANPGGQIRGWHAAAQRFIKDHPQREVQRLGPCPHCKGPYLVQSTDLRLVNDLPYIECRDPDCRRVFTTPEYNAYMKTLTRALQAVA
ncbi:hypothetical protein AB0451_03175 [Streptomyces sp. NPDC052000]|uniref:hypothetical protein n=1 Tax=Streptomyces sp. NPDC052000 TaxID=3155676 RepID=UPI00344D8B39